MAVITPRRTRLVRVADLHAFRAAIVHLASAPDLETARATAVVVPTRGGARQLRRTIERRLLDRDAPPAMFVPNIVTRDQLYDLLQARLSPRCRRLTAFERDAIARAAAREACQTFPPPFRLRPGLVAEAVRFYDQLRRQRQSVGRFQELVVEALERDTDLDRGAARMLEQTRFLAATFSGYERRLVEARACDEHSLRERVLDSEPTDPVRHVIVTVGDWIADPHGLYAADFDLLTRLPGVERIDLVATERLLASGLHRRVGDWLPELEETTFPDVGRQSSRPVLATPEDNDSLIHQVRDREEELVAVARRVKSHRPPALDRVAVVFKRPLPYLYLARTVFGAARIPYETQDALPLAAEPSAAALDLLLDAAESSFNRESLVALLRSPHFVFSGDHRPASPEAIAALDRMLSDARYLGEPERLRAVAAGAQSSKDAAAPALTAAMTAIAALEPLTTAQPMSRQLTTLAGVVRRFGRRGRLPGRTVRAEAAILALLDSLAGAYAASDDPPVEIDALAADLRRWLEDETFVPESNATGVQVVDAEAARYGDFDDVTIVGLIESEWPERPRRNIFYPPALLAALGWPPEQERQGAATAAFVDLLGSARQRTAVSTFQLDDEALVEPSILIDEIETAGLEVVRLAPEGGGRVFDDEALSLDPVLPEAFGEVTHAWALLRMQRTAAGDDAFHGVVGPRVAHPLSVSSIERYLKCPFQFFAQHVLRLEEEPEDDEVMDPRKQGEFIHEVFETFFREWQKAGRARIGPSDLDDARQLFAAVAEIALERLPEAEASIERTRLLGSPVAPGLGDVVFRMESERPIDVVERLLEYRLDGAFVFDGPAGPRTVELRGVADRIDLLADKTFRLVDYKLSSAPNKSKALQLPIYGLCAEQRLAGHGGARWSLGEAAYIAFRGAKGAKRVVPLFTARARRDEVLTDAQQRLVSAVDSIEAGHFPPSPEDVFFCDYCSYATVCRKDYVGDV